jgi:hypothetical protein
VWEVWLLLDVVLDGNAEFVELHLPSSLKCGRPAFDICYAFQSVTTNLIMEIGIWWETCEGCAGICQSGNKAAGGIFFYRL